MKRAIDDYKINGVKTTLDFCRFVMEHDAFVSGKFDTHFVKKYFTPETTQEITEDEMKIAAFLSVKSISMNNEINQYNKSTANVVSSWKANRLAD